MGDLFRLQDEMTQGIVDSLRSSLGGPTRPERPGESPASARADEFYLRANEGARDMAQLKVARDLYLRCVAEDPGFAPAWARLGRAHRVIGKYLDIPELGAHQARAEEALRRALELSPQLPLAHKLYAHLEAEVGRAQDAVVRLLRVARETRNDPGLFAGLVHACRYSGLLESSLAAHREAHRHTRFRPPRPRTPAGGLEAWEAVAQAFSPQTPVVREWIDDVRAFLTLSEASRPAVFRNLDGAFDPEEIFFVGTQAARLGMPEAVTILSRAVDGGYPARDALARHPWIAPIRGEHGLADVLRRAELVRERALAAFREAGGQTLLGLDALVRSSFDGAMRQQPKSS